MARSPLLLSVMVLAYQGRPAEGLAALDAPAARRRHLFDAYVQRMLVWRGPDPDYPPERTVPWLAWLARRMGEHLPSRSTAVG